eukprot:TRINITY_DN22843_c0_g1_i1.p1 TRINITY_DN22843_c0_g1~~TRINITY_DN22843_c0_g1_i1.p1  ORF type:complete len:239 (-),score=29.34 TRINITY_DN22843_c0_g1_i1:26-742(-)
MNSGFEDETPTQVRDGISEFATYEEYLDAQIKPEDLFYLEDEDLARQLIEYGQRGSGDTLSREDFEARKREIEEMKYAAHSKAPKVLCHAGKDLSHSPFLQALAAREENVRNGKLTSIIFIRDRNKDGQEISGYLDYAHRLKTEDFTPYFDGSKKLLPRPSDLSYYNWETQTCTSNPTPNFQVISDSETGLLFKNKRDRKTINVDPTAHCGDNSSRHQITDPNYIQIVIYDHRTRRKS